MKNTRTLLAALCIALGASHAKADLTVDISSISLVPNGTGTVDITISSNSSDPLQFYSLDLEIDRTGGSTLEFIDPQSESHLTDGGYLFAGDTFGGGFSAVDTTTDANDTLTAASDFTDSFADVLVPGTSVLLYRLDVQHFEDPFNPGNVGDTFSISVTGSNFEDKDFFQYTPTFNTGTVTIVIPEPSSLFLCSIATVLCLRSCLSRKPYPRH